MAELARRHAEREAGLGAGAGGAITSARCRAPCSRSTSRPARRSQAGHVVCIVEAMKMENEVTAHVAGVVESVGGRGRAGSVERPGHLRHRRSRSGGVSRADIQWGVPRRRCFGRRRGLLASELLGRVAESGAFTGATLSRPRAIGPFGRRSASRPTRSAGREGRRVRVRRHFETRTVDRVVEPREAATPARRAPRRRVPAGRSSISPMATTRCSRAARASRRCCGARRRGPSCGSAHDRAKQRAIPEQRAAPFLVALGVQTADGKVRAQRQRQVPPGQPVLRAGGARAAAAARAARSGSSTSARGARTSRSRCTTS